VVSKPLEFARNPSGNGEHPLCQDRFIAGVNAMLEHQGFQNLERILRVEQYQSWLP
jgi:hypothetical protein